MSPLPTSSIVFSFAFVCPKRSKPFSYWASAETMNGIPAALRRVLPKFSAAPVPSKAPFKESFFKVPFSRRSLTVSIPDTSMSLGNAAFTAGKVRRQLTEVQ